MMKIGVAGTGAIGGYFGGVLARSGNEVVFLTRSNNFATFKKTGLIVESETEIFVVNETFTDSFDSFSDVDLVLICVKSTDTREIAQNLEPVLKENAMILTMQNGVDNEEILTDYFRRNQVLSAAAYIQAVVKVPGTVKQIGLPPQLVIGSQEPDLKESVDKIASIFNTANIGTSISNNILEVKWKKLLWNVTFNPLSALIETEVSSILDDEGLCTTAIGICKEAIHVARHMGFEIEESYYKQIIKQGQMARNHKTSMLQDKVKGRPMELDSICGFIIKNGKEWQVPTPILETVYHLLKFSTITS